jgi:CheY-like chemotaxis protein
MSKVGDMDSMTRTVLVVDDEPFILERISSLLSDAGFRTHTCHMWAGVATVVRSENPDLILLDYNMPGLRGDDICTILKRNAVDDSMKIVLFSAEDESDLVRITASCGADGYIKKNTPAPELIRMLHDILSSSAYAS